MTLDAFVRSIGVRRSAPIAVFLGAGASTSSGIPSAQMCIWEWKRQIFLTNNPGLEDQFAELSLDGVRRRIQRWLDKQETYPRENTPDEYGFYIRQCFPISDDRRAYFAELIRHASPHIGYRLLCHLAQADLVRSVWSPNFDCLAGPCRRQLQAQSHRGRHRHAEPRQPAPAKGELLCVSMHGDYRYDPLKNTAEELQRQEAALHNALVAELRDTSLVVAGYSGRDQSLMDALRAAYASPAAASSIGAASPRPNRPLHVAELIEHVRSHGRKAYFVASLGFDDLLTRLSLHCLQGDARKAALAAMEEFALAEINLRASPGKSPSIGRRR